MLSLLLLLPIAAASQGWVAPARAHIPDRITVELELAELGIAPPDASYLGGESWWRSEADGQTHQQHALRWMRLSDAPLAVDESNPDASKRCAQVSGRDPIPGGRTLHLYRSALSPSDVHTPTALGARPGVVLASTDDGEVAMVALRPGDQVTLIESEHNRRGDRHEQLELRRGQRLLTLTRDGGSPEACYTLLDQTGTDTARSAPVSRSKTRQPRSGSDSRPQLWLSRGFRP